LHHDFLIQAELVDDILPRWFTSHSS